LSLADIGTPSPPVSLFPVILFEPNFLVGTQLLVTREVGERVLAVATLRELGRLRGGGGAGSAHTLKAVGGGSASVAKVEIRGVAVVLGVLPISLGVVGRHGKG
jgi:hypothetical protein